MSFGGFVANVKLSTLHASSVVSFHIYVSNSLLQNPVCGVFITLRMWCLHHLVHRAYI